MELAVLDHGYVRLLDTLGTDLEPVNDARVSFDKRVDEWDDKQQGLLNYLAKHGHTSPFRGAVLKFEVYAPMLVKNQWYKYVIGSEHEDIGLERSFRDPFLQWNETSRRYVTEEPLYYQPGISQWRAAPASKKQGSGDLLSTGIGSQVTELQRQVVELGQRNYERALAVGVAPEQARLMLSAYGLYIRWRWTASLQGVLHLIAQRLASDAQQEFQDYARQVMLLTVAKFPHACTAWLGDSIEWLVRDEDGEYVARGLEAALEIQKDLTDA